MARTDSWFRFYNEAVEDPKVQRLPAELFKAWVNLLCLASKNGGVLPCVGDIAYRLRMTDAKAADAVQKLVEAGLLDDVDGSIAPHNWNARQFKSDVSTDRVKRFRERSTKHDETVSAAVPETPPEQSRTDTDQSRPEKGASPIEVSALLSKTTAKVQGRSSLPPDQRKAVWQTRICNEAERTMTPPEYQRWMVAYAESEPWAKRKAEELDKGIKQQRARA